MAYNHLILCRPLFLLPSIFPSITVFSKELALCIRWPKYWSFSISSSNEYSELISFRIDSFDPLTVQGTLKSSPAPQFERISSLVLRLLYGPTLTSIYDYWKNHSYHYMGLCQQGDISVLYMLSRSVLVFLPKSKHLWILWLQSPSTVILEPKKIKSVIVSTPPQPHLFALKWWDCMPWSLFLECWVFHQLFHSPLSTWSGGSLAPFCSLPLGWYHLCIWGYWYFSQQSWFQLLIHPFQNFTWCTLCRS